MVSLTKLLRVQLRATCGCLKLSASWRLRAGATEMGTLDWLKIAWFIEVNIVSLNLMVMRPKLVMDLMWADTCYFAAGTAGPGAQSTVGKIFCSISPAVIVMNTEYRRVPP